MICEMRLRKPLRIEDMILIAFSFLSSALLVIMLTYFIEKDEIALLTNNFYSEHSIHFLLREDNQSHTDLTKLAKNEEYILFKENISDDPYIKGIYINGKPKLPSTIEGRFFKEEDFFSDNRIAVIGKNVKNTIIKKNKEYYSFDGEFYEVIGKMGGDFETKIDHTVYLNLNKTLYSPTNFYVLDGSKDNESIYNQFISLLGEKIERLDIAQKGSGSFYENENNNLKIVVLLVGSSVFIINIFLINYWIYKKKVFIAINYLIGHPPFKFWLTFGKRYFTIFISSHLLSCIFLTLLISNVYSIAPYSYIQISLIYLAGLSITNLLCILLLSNLYSAKSSLRMLKK